MGLSRCLAATIKCVCSDAVHNICPRLRDLLMGSICETPVVIHYCYSRREPRSNDEIDLMKFRTAESRS